MTRQEFAQIATALKAVYADPKFMDSMGIEVWYKLFEKYPYDAIASAVSKYIMTDNFGKAPVPGQIISCIETGKGILNEEEAWERTYKGLCNSLYNSKEEFAKLPPECQKAIGSADNMKNLAMLDADVTQSVEKSHFIKVYKKEIEKKIMHDRTVEGLLEVDEKTTVVIEDKKPDVSKTTTSSFPTAEELDNYMEKLKTLIKGE